MRTEYRRALQGAFRAQIAAVLPEFEPARMEGARLAPAERAYRQIASSSVHLFIILTPDPHGHEAFTVEFGWSMLGRFPDIRKRPSITPSPGRAEFRALEAIARLPDLTGRAPWWVIDSLPETTSLTALLNRPQRITASQAEQRVTPLAQEAVSDLQHYARPYLDQFLQHLARLNRL